MYNITIKSIDRSILDKALLSINIKASTRKEVQAKAERYWLQYPNSQYFVTKLF